MRMNFNVLTSKEKREGKWGIFNLGNLEFALVSPDIGFRGVNQYDDLYSKVAVLMYHITKSHAFIEGNKRTGFTLADSIMILNGRVIVARKTDRYQMSLDIDCGRMDVNDIAAWLKDNSLETALIVPSMCLAEGIRLITRSGRTYKKKAMGKKRLVIYKQSSRAHYKKRIIKDGAPYIYRY